MECEMRKIVFRWWISRIMSELIAMIVGTFTGVLCYGFIIGSIVLMTYMSAGGLFGILLIILLLISLLFFLLHSIIFAANRDKSLPTPAFGFRDLKVPFPVKLFCFQAFGLDLALVSLVNIIRLLCTDYVGRSGYVEYVLRHGKTDLSEIGVETVQDYKHKIGPLVFLECLQPLLFEDPPAVVVSQVFVEHLESNGYGTVASE